MRVFNIPGEQLAACPTRTIHPKHYRPDGTCLHLLREREPVTFRADHLDDGVREFYNGAEAVIVAEAEPDLFGMRYLVEFESGNQLNVSFTEVEPREEAPKADE